MLKECIFFKKQHIGISPTLETLKPRPLLPPHSALGKSEDPNIVNDWVEILNDYFQHYSLQDIYSMDKLRAECEEE
jgi:hypothetical protein